ncbi:hypothetical protein NDU88_003971 [Pleurodeles waltl]|uniref:Uncharacterized protein n=1 Tax=Pleurodeles waltl TaxID=8319 RepID=A0AAV7LN16_PLEWA|nr:hypothetical protein NDU88_003971 [Pleurodeles waltl]
MTVAARGKIADLRAGRFSLPTDARSVVSGETLALGDGRPHPQQQRRRDGGGLRGPKGRATLTKHRIDGGERRRLPGPQQ